MNNQELLNHPLFKGIDENDLPAALALFDSFEKELKKGEQIFHAATVTEVMGFIIEGRIQIESTDYWGNKTIIDNLGSGKVFGETYALTGKPLMVDVLAVEDSKILLLNPKKLFAHNEGRGEISSILIKNILKISMNKNLHLSQRIFHTTAKTIRGRLLAYLSSCVPAKNPAAEFDIPFDRQQLADYLQVDRSALSAELSKMKADGLIDYWKNHFKLL
ncbi:cAMP-binding protein [Treponema sp. JC4]|uniref:Crp/Fnr family transcriptional regulator n=1 Tax=Treponema sp. JC4 TaxID=1124982 RepID=UPI00025AFBDD|nr:Crp/Fnr family transcriptional regulator [Treponema sp. JC4]EID85097.1 cAMP-binding protein [Treponema sp. JC4]